LIQTWGGAIWASIKNTVIISNCGAGFASVLCRVGTSHRPVELIQRLSNIILSHTLVYHHNHTLPHILQWDCTIIAPTGFPTILDSAAINNFGLSELKFVREGDETNDTKPICENQKHSEECKQLRASHYDSFQYKSDLLRSWEYLMMPMH
jgi:hypothetical protein